MNFILREINVVCKIYISQGDIVEIWKLGGNIEIRGYTERVTKIIKRVKYYTEREREIRSRFFLNSISKGVI